MIINANEMSYDSVMQLPSGIELYVKLNDSLLANISTLNHFQEVVIASMDARLHNEEYGAECIRSETRGHIKEREYVKDGKVVCSWKRETEEDFDPQTGPMSVRHEALYLVNSDDLKKIANRFNRDT
jgi:hypothetical protein